MQLWVLLQGICTHVSDVKPHIVVATYTDAETGYEVYQQVTGTLPVSCCTQPTASCACL